MVSFGKQKTKVLRFGVPLLLIALGVILPLLTNVKSVSADSFPTPTGTGQSYLVVSLTRPDGKFDAKYFQGYTITAKRSENIQGGANDLKFTYQTNGVANDNSVSDYLSDGFNWAGDPANCTAASPTIVQNQNKFTVTVAKDNKTLKTAEVNGCGQPNYFNAYVQVVVQVDDNAQTPGSVSGTFKYTSAEDGAAHNATSTAKGTIVCSDQQSHNIVFDNNGHYSVTGLPPGDCTINAEFTSTDTNAKTFFIKNQKVKVESGKDTVADLTGVTGTDIPNDPSSDDNGDSKFIDCGSGGFNFFICPALKLAIAAGSKIDSFIMTQLEVDATTIFDKTNDKKSPSYGYYQAWSQFRIIATSLLIIGGLVMVASTALGFEFLDAYTIRKTLPRLLIAIIGISLSWWLMKLCVTFFDTLGFDIRAIMYHPFKDMTGQVGVGTGILSSFTVGVGLFAFGPTALTFILTACLALFVGFLILVIRQAAIIMLIILAPVAIACFILPNTQKVWKLWSDNFFGLLLMFPIISALIAAGHIFAAVTVSSNQGDSPTAVIAQAIAIIAYFIPYFLLPMAARLATGIIGNLAGFVNDRHKGAFDRLKKGRENALNRNLHNMKNGNRFSDRNAVTRAINRTTAGVGTGWKGHYGLGVRGSQAIDQVRRNAAVADIMKSPAWNAIQHDDDTLKALTYNNAREARQGLIASGMSAQAAERAVASAQASLGFGRPQAIAAAQQLSSTGTGYKNMQDLAQTIARASGGDATTIASLAGFINSDTKRAGRHDLAPGFQNLNDLARHEAGLSGMNGTQAAAAYGKAQEKAWNSGSLYQIGNGKTAALNNMVSHWKQQYQEGLSTGNVEQITKARTAYYELREMKTQASGENASVINSAIAEFDSLADRFGQTATGPNETDVHPDPVHLTADTAARAQARTMRQDPAFAARMASEQ